jgi:O-methyltransferase
MNKRRLAARVIRRPLYALDWLNYSARYSQELETIQKSAEIVDDRFELHEYIHQVIGNTAIDYLEFGVWQGKTFKKWLNMNSSPGSRFFGFDSFEGLPEDWEKGQPKGTFSVAGDLPKLADTRSEFVVGWFQDTLYEFLKRYPLQRQLVVHIDCDLYSSTMFVLAALDRHLPKHSILIFDDYSSLTHEFAAWLDYRRSFGRKWDTIVRTGSGRQIATRLID